MILGIFLGFVGTLVLQILGIALWWYGMVRKSGEGIRRALERDFADVRKGIRHRHET